MNIIITLLGTISTLVLIKVVLVNIPSNKMFGTMDDYIFWERKEDKSKLS